MKNAIMHLVKYKPPIFCHKWNLLTKFNIFLVNFSTNEEEFSSEADVPMGISEIILLYNYVPKYADLSLGHFSLLEIVKKFTNFPTNMQDTPLNFGTILFKSNKSQYNFTNYEASHFQPQSNFNSEAKLKLNTLMQK